MDNNHSNVTMLLHNVCELYFVLKHDTMDAQLVNIVYEFCLQLC